MNSDFFRLHDGETAQGFLEMQVQQANCKLNSFDFAIWMDKQDPLSHVRNEFFYPKLSTLPKGEYPSVRDQCRVLSFDSFFSRSNSSEIE